jgi:hypothetical protein
MWPVFLCAAHLERLPCSQGRHPTGVVNKPSVIHLKEDKATMSGKSSGGPMGQGVELIEKVIERVKADPASIAAPYGPASGNRPLVEARPLPAKVIARLTFPSGKPLPPSLKRWLAFDAGWLFDLGWFSSLEEPAFAPRSIAQIVRDEFHEPWGEIYEPLADHFAECFLLPGGSDQRRIYAVTEPDVVGEYPVLVVDTDDQPWVAVTYPGFDVFIAYLTGYSIRDFKTSLFEDERYASRMNDHAHRLFGGKEAIDFNDAEWGATWPEEHTFGCDD